MFRQSLTLAASLIALTAAARAEAPFNFDHTPGKLPKTVVPAAYKIDITPDLQKLTLTGTETIALTVRHPTATITMNQAGLKIASARLEDGSTATAKNDEDAQTVTLTFPHPIAAGAHTLSIAYTGPILLTPNGIYADDYKAPNGAQKRMLVTQFEVADARRMFPGWDEPAFKSTFQLSVTLPKDLTAVSNMPIASQTDSTGNLTHINFQTSPRMSTYLLALVAGDITALRTTAGGAQMAAYAPTGEQAQAAYSLDVEKHVLPYYNEYFGTPYPLPKLDLLAIPGNYEAGAMENWGAITFIDNDMLFDPKTSAPSTKEDIYLTVSHEMAHQWSGDLVTMGWWDNIWLNEGFATWMEEKATDHFNPAWQIWPRQHGTHEAAMAQDAQPTTHPIQQPIRDESEANSAFDQISYQKGEQIIRMIETYIGEDKFRDGMRIYMAAHKYNNSTSADLWAALSQAAGTDVGKIAAGFTEQPGIPLIHVARACEGGHATITLTQDRFTINDPHPKAETWQIPVTYGAPGTTPQKLVLGTVAQTIQLPKCASPVKLNFGETGYYRTQYDAASLKALQAILPKLSATDRANLLADQFALFVADRAPLSDYLALLPALKSERNIAVWHDTIDHLERLTTILQNSDSQAGFNSYAISLVRPQFARLGWDAKPNESFLDTLLRPELIGALAKFNDPQIIAQANKRFAAFTKDQASLAPALRKPVFDSVGHHADQAMYDTLKKLGTGAVSTEEKLRYFDAMGAVTDPALMQQNVAFATSGLIPNGRILSIIQSASANSGNPDLLFKLVLPHEAEFAARIPADGFGITAAMVATLGSSNPDTAKQMLALKSSNDSIGAKTWAARIAGAINTAAELRARTVPVVAAWLAGKH